MDSLLETRTGIATESSISSVEIAHLKEEGYKFFANLPLGKEEWEQTEFFNKIDYDEDRGERKDRKGYIELLPKIDGKNVEQVIDELIANNRGRRVNILDVGSWMGYPLLNCQKAEKWKGKLKLTGITARIVEGQRKFLEEQDIRTIVGDAHNLTALLKDEKFDLIVSNKTIGYMADSARVLEQIWGCLRKEGVALISGFLWPENKLREVGRLNSLIKRFGEKVNFLIMPECFERKNCSTGKRHRHSQVTMVRNTDDKLALPLQPESIEKFDPAYPAVVFYKTNGNLSGRVRLSFLPRFLSLGK